MIKDVKACLSSDRQARMLVYLTYLQLRHPQKSYMKINNLQSHAVVITE